MKALISPLELVETGYRVAQVQESAFDVAPPLFWVDCELDVKQDSYWFDPLDNTCKLLVVEPELLNEDIAPETQTGVI